MLKTWTLIYARTTFLKKLTYLNVLYFTIQLKVNSIPINSLETWYYIFIVKYYCARKNFILLFIYNPYTLNNN